MIPEKKKNDDYSPSISDAVLVWLWALVNVALVAAVYFVMAYMFYCCTWFWMYSAPDWISEFVDRYSIHILFFSLTAGCLVSVFGLKLRLTIATLATFLSTVATGIVILILI